MSDAIQKLQRALSQAQTFVEAAPLEALARASAVAKQVPLEMANASAEEREQLATIAAIAASRVSHYETLVSRWDHGVRDRAELFHTHEVERLQRPIASKI